MSQRDALRALDDRVLGMLRRAGLSDAGEFRAAGLPAGAPGTACDVLVDRDVRLFGDDDAEVATPHVVVTLYHAQVQPSRGATVVVGAETFRLEALLSQDESKSRWVVSP